MEVGKMRRCYKCNAMLRECMGSVNYKDFMLATEGKILFKDVRELCGKCIMIKLLFTKGEMNVH